MLSWVPGPALPQMCYVISGEPLTLPRSQFPHLVPKGLSLLSIRTEESWEVISATASEEGAGSSLLTWESWTPRPAEQFILGDSAQPSPVKEA